MLANIVRDAQLALRGLRKDKAFALTALLSIGLGVGANAATFSLVNQALFRFLPVKAPDRLVLLDWRGSFVGAGWGSANLMSFPFYTDLRDDTDVFDGVFGRAPTSLSLALQDTAEYVSAEIVTGSYFGVLGVRPFLGRLIDESDDDQPGAHPVIVVSYDFWRTRLGAQRDVIGRTVRINTYPMTVIGVAEARFRGIDWGNVPALWIPTMMKRQATPDFDWLMNRRGRWLHVFGRLKPGMTPLQAQASLEPWFKAMLAADTTREDWPRVTPEQQKRYLAAWLQVLPASGGRSDLRETLERPLLVLLAATALILLLACLNVANLYLARGFARRRETAVRLALGASRGRIVQELLVQSAILAAGGAVLGVAMAPAVTRTLLSFLPQDLAGIDLSADASLRVFVFALAAALATVIVSSLAPALRVSRTQPSLTLKEQSSTIGAGIGLRKALVVGQIAIALVLLVGAGLFVRTLRSLRATGPGFSTTNLLTFRIDTKRAGYSSAQSRQIVRQLDARLRALPGVEGVAESMAELLSGGSWNQRLTIDAGHRVVTESSVHLNAVSPGFFKTLGVELVAGRDFDERDIADPAAEQAQFRSAIVNETLARHYFGDRNPIGARLGISSAPDAKTPIEIVGVVRTFAYRNLRETSDQAFVPFYEIPSAGGGYWIRTRAASTAAFASIRAALQDIDPTLPTLRLTTVDDTLDRSLMNERLLAMLASAFAGLALLLSVVGIYGVVSFVVSRRTQEIGIRMALGASRGAAVGLIVRDAAVMLAWGIAIALPSAWALGRFVESQLFGVSAHDWPTALAASTIIAIVALGASALPVTRATAINPIEALRTDG